MKQKNEENDMTNNFVWSAIGSTRDRLTIGQEVVLQFSKLLRILRDLHRMLYRNAHHLPRPDSNYLRKVE